MILAVASAQREEEEMAEPLDPAAFGVASALKILRARTGLREERLRGVLLDTLTGLEGVQMLVKAGQSPGPAIVDVVRTAAKTLEPTMSIVADASLRLRLFADQVPDGELYAEDLGQRREALRRNWDRLHKLRSVPSGKAPSVSSLRLKVEERALAALAVALTTSSSVDVSARTPAAVTPAGQTLRRKFQDVARALRGSLTMDVDSRFMGWRHDLRNLPDKVTPVSTAFGVRAMLLLEDGLAADLIQVAESLRRMADSAGGYASRGQVSPRPESTAAVLNALRRIAATEDIGDHIAQMERDLRDLEKSRPFILTTMLETGLLLGPESSLVETLLDRLLATRRPYGRHLLWPEQSDSSLVDPFPSVAHTARAVRALADVQAIRPAGQIQEAVDQGVAWLIEQSEQSDLLNTNETIERPHRDGIESVRTWHFTAAWVVKALVSAGVPASHPAVSKAVDRIWRSYGGDTVNLWHSDQGELPIWMTFDAIEALRLASVAVPAPAR